MPALGTCLFGRALDACGVPLDAGPLPSGPRAPADPDPPAPAHRMPVAQPFWTGVRAIDGLLAIGRGARIGIFGAPGTGKSTLLESIVRHARADAVAIALAGERGREAQRWIAARDRKTTLFCATSDRPASERVAAATLAMAHADALRRRGLHVLLVLDSLARVAAALRECATGSGEALGRGGFPPSVFARLARLVEVAGCAYGGSITLVATVLDDGDARDPVSDAARSLLDGHVVLDARLGNAGHHPAIDVPGSASRTMGDVSSPDHAAAARRVRRALAVLDATREARSLGIEPLGADERAAVAAEPALLAFLAQGSEPSPVGRTLGRLFQLADTLEEPHGHQ